MLLRIYSELNRIQKQQNNRNIYAHSNNSLCADCKSDIQIAYIFKNILHLVTTRIQSCFTLDQLPSFKKREKNISIIKRPRTKKFIEYATFDKSLTSCL